MNARVEGVATSQVIVFSAHEKKLLVPFAKISFIEQITDNRVRVHVGDFLNFEASGDLDDMATLMVTCSRREVGP